MRKRQKLSSKKDEVRQRGKWDQRVWPEEKNKADKIKIWERRIRKKKDS